MNFLQKRSAKASTGSFSGKKTLLVRIVISQALIGALLVSLLSFYIFRQFAANSVREITRSSAEGLNQSVRVFETLWDSTYRYMNKEFLTNGLLMDAQNLEEFDPVFSGDVFRYLSNMVYNSGLFHSVYIYNGKLDVLFSSLGPMKQMDEFYDQNLVELLRSGSLNMSPSSNNTISVRHMTLRNGVGPYDGGVLSVLFSDNNFRSAMIVNIDLQVLQNLVSGGDTRATAHLLVLTDEGIVLADSFGKEQLRNVSKEPAFMALDRALPAGTVLREWEDMRWLVSWQHWHRQDGMNWWFVSVADYRVLLSGVQSFQRQVLVVAGLFILLSLLISFLFGQRIYSPISRLLEKIRMGQPKWVATEPFVQDSAKPVSEIEFLSHTYESLNSNVSRLLSFETAGRGPVRQHCLKRLLNGQMVSKAELARSLSEKSWLFSSEGFQAVELRFDDVAVLSLRHSSDDMALLRFAVLNIADELFRTVMGVESFEVSEEWLCLILHVGDPAEVPTGQAERIREVIEKIQGACRKHLAISLTAGIGEEVSLVADIRQSWQQAITASSCRFTEGAGSILFHADMRKRYEQPYLYPAEAERELIESLRAGETLRQKDCFDRFCHEIAGVTPQEALLALTQLSIAVARTVDSCMAEEDSAGIPIVSSPHAFETLDALRDSWSSAFTAMAECMRRKREARHDELLSKVKKRVEESYSDANLTVELLAQEAGLSANYLRTLYKEAFGQSMTEHIATLRFHEAKRLLRATALPANRIAGMVGYQGSGYFYTAFRKVTGMTPEEYRRSSEM